MRFLPLAAGLAVALLALAGCSSDPPGPVTPPMDDAHRHVIKMPASGTRFLPADAEVPVGATVAWVNLGATPHDVVAEDGAFSSDAALGHKVREGEEFTHTFPAEGTFRYRCTLHSGMDGTLRVTAPAATPVAA